MNDLEKLVTEQQNSKTIDLDILSIRKALEIMNEEDQEVALMIKENISQVEKAVKSVIKSFNLGGRLIYLGAGTSGRLGVLDAVECPPTFGTCPEKVVGLIAGGERAFIKAVEGAEDSKEMGSNDLKSLQLIAADTVVGLAASGRTPYVLGALEYANKIGCQTISIACNKNSMIGKLASIPIEIEVGPEILTGSTRLKAGTAQKMVLNMISTISMVGIGKVYQNLMVDVQLTNEKLRTRAENIFRAATGAELEIAQKLLVKADGDVKLAITMFLLDCDSVEAKEKLKSANGFIRKILM